MPYSNLSHTNNAMSTLAGGLSAIGTILIVKSTTGEKFPSTYPYFLCVERIESGAVTKREIVKVIRRDGDVFLIQRGAGYCLASDTATTQTNTGFDFFSDDKVSLRLYNETIEDIQGEITRIQSSLLGDATDLIKGTAKMSVAPISPTEPIALSELDTRLPTQSENDALAGTSGTPGSANKYITATDPDILNNVDLSNNQTVAGIKTFSSIPILPSVMGGFPTSDNQLVSKVYIDWLTAIIVNDTHPLASPTNAGSYTDLRGFRFIANKDILIQSIIINSPASPYFSRAFLKTDAGATIESVSFTGSSGQITVTFSGSTIIANGTYFRIEIDSNSSSTTYRRFTPTFPISKTNLNYVSGSIAGSDDATYGWNIETITTKSLT